MHSIVFSFNVHHAGFLGEGAFSISPETGWGMNYTQPCDASPVTLFQPRVSPAQVVSAAEKWGLGTPPYHYVIGCRCRERETQRELGGGGEGRKEKSKLENMPSKAEECTRKRRLFENPQQSDWPSYLTPKCGPLLLNPIDRDRSVGEKTYVVQATAMPMPF